LLQQAVQAQGAASISGPQGFGSEQYVPAGTQLPYTVRFKNPAEASTTANEVRIVAQLDAALSARSFRLGDLKIGGISITMPSDRANYQGDFDFTQSLGFIVRVSAGIDATTGIASWVLQAIDPETGEVLQDATRGLLPPDNAQGQGSGFVSYTVASAFDVPSGTPILASARVLMDNQAPIETNTITSRLDATAPVTTVTVQQVVAGGGDYQVSWQAAEESGGSGVRHTTVYVRVDGGDWTIWQRQSTDTSGLYVGTAGQLVEFMALSTDNAGNRERPAEVAVPDDGSSINLGGTPSVGSTTVDIGVPPAPSVAPSTNPLFSQAERGVPSLQPSTPSQFTTVLAPFVGAAFGTGITQSFAGIGPLAMLERPDGTFIVSGGGNRGALYLFDQDGGRALAPEVQLDVPVYDLAYDARGGLWATSGGGALLELDAGTLQILNRYGDGLTQSLAFDAAKGVFYVSSAGGIERFDPSKRSFTHFSDVRVDDLAVAPDGTLWGSTWPDRGDLVTFNSKGRAQVQVHFEAGLDSITFGKAGTSFQNLLFASSRRRTGDATASLYMVDLVTLRKVELARGGPGAEQLIATTDGRLLVANGEQVDVVAPLVAPQVVRVTPADGALVPLPMGEISVVFDHDMLASSADAADSVTNVANYLLTRDGVAMDVRSVRYDADSHTATLRIDAFDAGAISLTVKHGVRSTEGLVLVDDYTSGFMAISDFSPYVRIEFLHARSDRSTGTVSYDLRVTNIAEFDLLPPLRLVLDPARFFGGSAVGASTTGSLWLLDIAGASGGLKPGESSVMQTVTLVAGLGQRADLGTGIYALPYANLAPLIQSAALTQAEVGKPYSYQIEAIDPDGIGLRYLLLSGPEGMTLGATSGVLAWTPPAGSAATAAVVLRVYDARGGSSTQAFGIDVTGGSHAPQLTGLQPVYTLREGELLHIAFDAMDVDGQTIGLAADHLPAGMVFDAVGRTIDWLPGYGDAGVYQDLRILASDGILTTQASIQITVLPDNAPPELSSVPPRVVREGDPIRIAFKASDLDGDAITFASPNMPAGAFLDRNTGVFEWTPGFTQNGVYSVAIWASDNKVRSEVLLDLTVSNVNAAPQFDQQVGWNVLEGEAISLRAFAFDPDNPGYVIPDRLVNGTLTTLESTAPTVSYVATSLPAGATFDTETALFSWLPGFQQTGNYTVTFTATDDGNGTGVPLTSTIHVPITVRNANRQPVVPELGTQTVSKGQVLDVPIAVSDADGNPITVRFDNLPRFATYIASGNGTGGGVGVLRLAPGDRDRGDYVVTLVASDNGDGEGARGVLSASRTFVISSDSPTEPPLLATLGHQVAVVGNPLRFTVRASDLDQDALSFSATGLPAGATLTPGTQYGSAVFLWTPTSGDLGAHDVTFTVTDSAGNTDQRTITVRVRTSNAAPLLLPVGDQSVAEGATLIVDLAASDADGDALSYSATNLPPGAQLDAATGRLSWNTNYFNAGVYSGITVTASDGAASSSDTFDITVTQTNRAPLLSGIPRVGGQEDQLLQFTLVGTDPDGDPVIYAPVGTLPAGAFFDQATGLFEWTPNYSQAGDYTLSFTATDPGGLSETLAVPVSVADVNREPLPVFTHHQATLGETLRFRVVGTDPDSNEVLRLAARGLPEGATLDAVTGDLIWTPGPGQAGDYLVIVSITDGKATVERGLALRATELPVGPDVSISLTPSFPAVPGQPVAITVLADAFSAVASRTLTLNGAALALDERGRAMFTPPASGLYQLVATATDLDGLTSTTSLVLKVRDPLDSAAPSVYLSLSLERSTLTTTTAIRGRVADSNLESWQLEINRAGTNTWTLVAQGASTVDDLLAQLNPAGYEAGPYQLRLTATDVAGRSALALVSLELQATADATRYVREDTDFSAVLAGHTLDFTRRSDSLAADRAGAFGDGWRLAWRDVDLVTDLTPTGTESLGNYPPLLQGTRLFVTLPTGQRAGFTFAPVEATEAGVRFYRPQWVADAGVTWQLESFDAKLMRAGGRFYSLDGTLPYNPAALAAERAQYTLVAADGTRYEIIASQGVSAIAYTDGVRLMVTDSGVSAPNGDLLRFVSGEGGRIGAVVLGNGDVFTYEYDTQGRLIAARSLSAAQSTRYAYDDAGRLSLVSSPAGGVAIDRSGGATVVQPLAADLGAALAYVGATRSGSLAEGATERLAFSVRQSEIDATPGGAVLLGVVIGASAGTLAPALPQIAGLTPVLTRVQGNQAFALFRIDRAGLQLLQLAGAGAGGYALRLFVAGDANGDQRVDGRDADLMAAARAGAYDAAADFTLDGVVNASDSQLLYANLGYVPNQAPTAGTTTFKTHVDLTVDKPVGSLLADPEGDRLSLRVTGSTHGVARITGDGRTLSFSPAAGYTGAATVTLVADDGYAASAPTTLTINISDAQLVRLDFVLRELKLRAGDLATVQLVGDFSDELNVTLSADYVTLATLDPGIAKLGGGGVLTGVAGGATVLTAMRGNIQAATAVAVGVPQSPGDLRAYYFGIDAYPDAISLTPGTARQMVVQSGEGTFVSGAAAGTRYYVGDTRLLSVDADGKLVALADGNTTVTVIHRGAEQVVPVRVVQAVRGDAAHPAAVGTEGGVVLGDGGQLVAFGQGQLAGDALVSVSTLAATDLSAPLPEAMDFAAAFKLEVSGSTVSGPMQLAVQASNLQAGDKVYFFVEVQSDVPDGVMRSYWMPVDDGVVGADGYARSASPPWPGLSQNGNILMARANRPVRGLTIDLQQMFNPALLFIGSTSLIGLMYYLGTITFPLVEQARVINAYTDYAGRTINFQIPVDAGSTDARIRATVPQPLPTDTEAPVVATGANAPHYDPDTQLLTIQGSHFKSTTGEITATKVVFTQGGLAIEAAVDASSTDTLVKVTVPKTVVLGLADIVVRRPDVLPVPGPDGLPSTSTDNADSAIFHIRNQGGYAFVAGQGQVTPGHWVDGVLVVDTQRKGDPVGGPEQVIKVIELGRTAVATVATPDLARIFAAVRPSGDKKAAVVVIDGITLDPMDAKPSTPALDYIELPYGQTPTAMVLDPNGNYLYVACQGSIFVININPGSTSLNKLVNVITIDSSYSTTGKINDMAINADGTRLYITAPATELFGGTKSWVQGGRDAGKVLVINVDERDKPQPSVAVPHPPNLRKYQEVIADLAGGLEPYGISATSKAGKMVFTSRLKGQGLGGLQTITVTNDDPLSFDADVGTVNLQLSNNTQQKYQLYIRNPVDVVVTADLNWAFVVDWNLPLSVGSNAPGAMIEYMDTHETGSKVGIVKDPFGLNGAPQILAATTPIPLSFATELKLSSDGQKLYANYRGPGDLLVFDVNALLDKATNPGTGVDYTRRPIDEVYPQVNLPGISVARYMRGLSIQPYDPLTLLAPTGALKVGESAEAITFEWDVDTDALGTTEYVTRVYLSALQPGQGLWPDDAPRERTSVFESDPSWTGADNNPNRLWTSDILASDIHQITLPPEIAKLMTAGQTYFWGVRLLANGEIFKESSSFNAKPVQTGGAYNVVTVLTHGFQLNPVPQLSDPPYQQPAAFLDLARIIVDAAGGGVVLIYNKNTGEWVDPVSHAVGVAALQPGKAVVLVSDWVNESDVSDSGFSEAAADAIYASLADLDAKSGGNLFASPLQFIGHSRGTVVNSEIVQRMGVLNPTVKNIQMTTLDPHDQKQDSLNVPIATVLGAISKAILLAEAASLILPGAQVSFVTLNRIKSGIDSFLTWAERFGVALDIPYGDFSDPNVTFWSNIGFLDDYYQTKGTGAVGLTATGTSFGVTGTAVTATPNGVAVPGAALSVLLNGRAGFTQDDFEGGAPFPSYPFISFSFSFGFGGPHSRVWQWYAGTADTQILSFADSPIFRRVVDEGVIARTVGNLPTFQFNTTPWYTTPNGRWEGAANGWYYSPAGGGASLRPASTATPEDPKTTDNTEVTTGTEVVPTVFNGNFENGLRQSLYRRLGGSGDKYRFPLSYELPGWSFHGGSGFNLNLGPLGSLDLTGLFVFETNPLEIVKTVIDKVFDKIWDATIGVLINKAKADTFGVPQAPGSGSSEGYKTWYENTWSADPKNKAKVTLSDQLFSTFDKSITSLVNDLLTLGHAIDPNLPTPEKAFKVDGSTDSVNWFGIDALKAFLKKNVEVLLKRELGDKSSYALLMGGGQLIRTLVDEMFGGATPAVVKDAINSIVNLDSVTHNRLLVPTDQPVISFNIFAPLMASPTAQVQVIFHPTALDPGLADVALDPVMLQTSFMQRINYSFKVPDSFKGKVADIEFKVTGTDVTDNNLPLYDLLKDTVAVVNGVDALNQLVSQIFFLDDVRFSRGLQAQVDGPIAEGQKSHLVVSFAPADPTKPVDITVVWNDGSGLVEHIQAPAGTTSMPFWHLIADDKPTGTDQDTVFIGVSATNVIGATTASASQVVNNVAPSVGSLTVVEPGGGLYEAGEISISGTFTDPGLGNDSYKVEIFWGDGESTIVDATLTPADISSPTAGAPGTFKARHTYIDDNPTRTPVDYPVIAVRVIDDDGGMRQTSRTIVLGNKAPEIQTLTFDNTTIDEGGSTVLHGIFIDKGKQDTHEVKVTWDGGSAAGTVTFSDGVGSFEIPITVLDDTPEGTNGDDLVFTVELKDDDSDIATGTTTATLHVDNTDPALSLTVAPAAVTEGDTASFVLAITDAGSKDSFDITIDWGDGVTQTDTVSAGTGLYSFSRTFVADPTNPQPARTLAISVTVNDDDLGTGTATASLLVNPLPAGPLRAGGGGGTNGANSAATQLNPAHAGTTVTVLDTADAAGASTIASALAGLSAQARAAWAAVGADVRLLGDVQLVVTDLERDVLGLSVGIVGQGGTVYIDDDAAGRGWYVDATPAFNDEYLFGDGQASYWGAVGTAADRMDLLTLLVHEYGHMLGLAHAQAEQADAMNAQLNVGERRLPVATDLLVQVAVGSTLIDSGLLASGVTDGVFNNPAAWTTRGTVTIASGQATLAEDATFNSSLSQQLLMPLGARFLMFDLSGVQFGAAGAGIGDAFEMALLDLNTGLSLLGPIGLSSTDAAINVQSDGQVFAASGITFNGLITTVLPSAAGGAIQVRIDVSAIAAARPVLMSFDLLGFGALGSQVSIDNVGFVTAGNVAPVAGNDTASLPRDTTQLLEVLANDGDANGDPIHVASVTAPLHGTLNINADGTLSYTPDASYAGLDHFFYSVSDGQAGSSLARVDITVLGTNAAPVARPDTAVTSRNQPVIIDVLANDRDIDSTVLTPVIVAAPVHGSVSVNGAGKVVYTPATDYVGADQFSYRASDGALNSGVVLVAITVNGTNTAPVAVDDALVTDEDTPLVFDVRLNDSDAESGALTPVVAQAPAHGRLVLRGNGSFEYSPDADFNGSDSFTYRVDDGALSSGLATVTLTVRPVNDAPVIAAQADVVVNESQSLNLTLGASDADAGDVLTYTLTDGPAGASVSADGRLTWTPADGPASASFSVRVTDGSGAGSSRSFTAQVANLPPQVQASGAALAAAGQPYVLTLGYADVGADTVSGWFIDWGDGSTSNLPGAATSASHVFTSPGITALVSVRAQDDDGLWSAMPLTVRVLAPQVTPTPTPTPVPVPGTTPGSTPGLVLDSVIESVMASVTASLSGAATPGGAVGAIGAGADDRLRDERGLFSPRYTVGGRGLFGADAASAYALTSVHPFAQVTSLVTVDSNASGAALESETLATLLGSDAPSHPSSLLQVRAVIVTGGGLRVRLNQAVDVRALAAGDVDTHITVLRGDQPVKGRIQIDPDGLGFAFIAEGGVLPAGNYTVRLRASGVVRPGGQALDGDYDGKAGGDYRGRFTVGAHPLLGTLGEGDGASFAQWVAADGERLINLDGSIDWMAQRWHVQPDAAASVLADPDWVTLTGGIGGLVTLAAMPGAVDTRMARRALAAGARRRDGSPSPSDAAPIVIAPRATPAGEATAARRAPGWVARWLASRKDHADDDRKGWRIRL
jgi:VCBS repeat-containing protein/YD repeat-containing protein